MSNRTHAQGSLSDAAAEVALLASASRGGAEVLSGLIGLVNEDWFSNAAHQLGWRVLSNLIVKGLPMDFVVIENEFISAGMDRTSSKGLCDRLAQAVPTSIHWQHYATVLESWRMRRLGVQAAREMMERFGSLDTDPKQTLAQAEAALFELHTKRSHATATHRSVFIDRVIKDLIEAFSKRGHVIGGLGTGYTDLDRACIKGMRPGHFWMLAAPPGGGKTLLLSKILNNLALGVGDYLEFKQDPVPVLLVSLEMDGYELSERDVVRESRVSLAQMQQGLVSRKIMQDLPVSLRKLQTAPFYILHMPGASWEQVRVQVKFEIARLGIKVWGLDYVQALHSDAKDAKGNRTREMQIISVGVDQLAADTATTALVASQLTREGYGKKGGSKPIRPDLSHLRESAQLAQDADFVGMLSDWAEPEKKGDAKNQVPDWKKKAGGEADDDDEDEEENEAPFGDFMGLDIVKNRHGANTHGKPMIKLQWDRAYFDFVSTNKRLWDASGKAHQQN